MAAILIVLFLSFSVSVSSMGKFSNEVWSSTGKKPAQNSKIKVIFALKQVNTEWLEEKLASVSDPNSPNYGKYMRLPEIAKHVHGDLDAVTKVKEVLGSFDITPQFTLGEGFALVNVTIKIAEQIFDAEFYEFRHKVDKQNTVIRSIKSTIPNSLKNYVDFVAGISDFPSSLSQVKTGKKIMPYNGVHDGADITPKAIDKAYNISGFSATNPNNSQAIASFLGQYFSPDDLKSFQNQYNISSNPITKVLGTNKPSSPGMEASLDVQYITSIGRNVDTWFISVDKNANGKQEDFMSWLLELVNNSNTPWVHSISYGDYEHTINPDYITRTEEEFMKLGISGRTLLFASGDDGTSCSLVKGGKFEPMWPASSPHVTTVGGTVSMSEAWDHSGGGFSNHFQAPSYQQASINNYLSTAKSLPSAHMFNKNGRAYPDLSAFSVNYDIVILGIPWPVDGTSCATPTTAGIISLLNDIRLNNGQATLGFLNPLLYKLHGEGFTDIIQGTNHGKSWCHGFTAATGWDPASGWGSPNFGLLKNLI